MSIEEFFGDWSKVIDLKEAERVTRRLASSNISLCPKLKDIFKAFTLCPLNELKVVILGQDPYNNVDASNNPVATGIAFANSSDTSKECFSPSLEKLSESFIDYTVPHRTVIFDPSLEKLEAQGVLLLNAALTCEQGKANSHSLLWRPFMRTLLKNLSNYHSNIVYVLMGSAAQAYEIFIDSKHNKVFHIRHPSWYARTDTRMPSDIWSEVNKYIFGQYGTEIEWYQELK